MATDFISRELAQVKAKYNTIEGSELIACVKAMVQIKITKTQHKQMTLCFQFSEGYPRTPILLELKSRVMSFKLLDGLTKVCEGEAKKLIGQMQIIPLCIFVRKFIEENPLCVCSEEINHLKKNIIGETDELKLKQKTSQVILKLKEKEYFLTAKLTVPDDYPISQLGVEIGDHNFPELLKVNVLGQAVEITRQCVQPPLKKKPKDPPFQPTPALRPVTEYLVKEVIRKYPNEICPCCGKSSLPPKPQDVITDVKHDLYVERVYCSHLFHHGCLNDYMKTPPFAGGKKCPTCKNRIYHDKWKATPELAEARWAHKEAKMRELDEVKDFFD